MIKDVLHRAPKEVREQKEATGRALDNIYALAPHAHGRRQGPFVASSTLTQLLNAEQNYHVKSAVTLIEPVDGVNMEVFISDSNTNRGCSSIALRQDIPAAPTLIIDYDKRDYSTKDAFFSKMEYSGHPFKKDQKLLLELAKAVEGDLRQNREAWANGLKNSRREYLEREGSWASRMLDVIAFSMGDVFPEGFELYGTPSTKEVPGDGTQMIRLFTDAAIYESSATQLAQRIDSRAGDDPTAIRYKYEMELDGITSTEGKLSLMLKGGLGFSIENLFPVTIDPTNSPFEWGEVNPLEKTFEAFISGNPTHLVPSHQAEVATLVYKHPNAVPGVTELFQRTMHDETLQSSR